MKLRLRAAAVGDLDGIFDYSVARHGAEAAEAYMRTLKASMNRLLDFPELGSSRPELARGLRCFPVREHHIFYRIEGEDVVVARVLHKAMDSRQHL